MPNLVTVASFSSLPQASIAQGMLEAHDIPTLLNNVDFNSIYPMGGTGFAVNLQVRPQDADRATELLKEHGDL